jgi:hypothetical protein
MRRCVVIAPREEGRVDDRCPLLLSPSPPTARPNIVRGCMHGAGRFACRSGGDGEMRRRRLARPLHANAERLSVRRHHRRLVMRCWDNWSRIRCTLTTVGRAASLSACLRGALPPDPSPSGTSHAYGGSCGQWQWLPYSQCRRAGPLCSMHDHRSGRVLQPPDPSASSLRQQKQWVKG